VRELLAEREGGERGRLAGWGCLEGGVVGHL
jgi:hypothetical protein